MQKEYTPCSVKLFLEQLPVMHNAGLSTLLKVEIMARDGKVRNNEPIILMIYPLDEVTNLFWLSQLRQTWECTEFTKKDRWSIVLQIILKEITRNIGFNNIIH